MTFKTRYSNINALWSSLLIEELWRLGVRHCCIAPGSRSAPLTLEAAEHKGLTRHVHFDERGLGFFALGLAKACREPVAIITTSGTAVANLYPAIIEARQTGFPLVIVTADRPPELINCGANQAIEQQDIYSGYPGATLNLPAPNESISLNWVLTSIDQAFARSCQQGLPLHINCQFREPLYPGKQVTDYNEALSRMGNWLESRKPHTIYQLPELGLLPIPENWQDFTDGQGIIVAGRIDAGKDVNAVIKLAKKLGWPIIADIQSQLHGHPATLKHADLILANDNGRKMLEQADRVFQIGGHLISKRLDQFLSQHDWKHYFMLGRETRRMDTAHRQTLRLVGSLAESCYRLAETTSSGLDWGGELHYFAESVHSVLFDGLQQEGLTERWLCTELANVTPEKTDLFIGNSLPVRMIDMFSIAPLAWVYANRGASGIDGLMATAAGCCAADIKPLVMLVGDVSFLHDLNSLQLARQAQNSLVIVLINNDGGGIFNLLPMGEATDKASDYFVTPHGLNARHAAAMFGISYQAPDNQSDFIEGMNQALAQPGCTIIEVQTIPGQAAQTIRNMVGKVRQL